MEITKSNLSLEDLEQFRDEEGYIDLDKAGLEVAKESREVRGNEHRVKNWVDFNGSEVLIKEEAQLDQRNYGVYAQLIMVELAKQLGLPAAEYDLMKYKGKFGSISHRFGDDEKEIFQSVYEMIDTIPFYDKRVLRDALFLVRRFKRIWAKKCFYKEFPKTAYTRVTGYLSF